MRWMLIALWVAALATLGVGVALMIHRHSSKSQTTTFSTVRNPVPKHVATPTVNLYEVQAGGPLHIVTVAVREQADAATALQLLHVHGTLTVSNDTATLTQAPPLQAAQRAEIVWTLTQFPSIKRVDLPGHKGLTRVDEASFAPPILIESPSGPNQLAHTFHVRGTASVFEGTLVVEVEQGNNILARKTVTATAGAPDLGTFDALLHVDRAGPADVVAYAPSAANGKPQHTTSVQVNFER